MAVSTQPWPGVSWMKRAAARHGIEMFVVEDEEDLLSLALAVARGEPAESRVSWPSEPEGSIFIEAASDVKLPWMIHDLAHGLIARLREELDLGPQEVDACAVTLALISRHASPFEALTTNLHELYDYFDSVENIEDDFEGTMARGRELLREVGYTTRGVR